MNIFKKILFNKKEQQSLTKENEVLKLKLVQSQQHINKTNAYYKKLLRCKS